MHSVSGMLRGQQEGPQLRWRVGGKPHASFRNRTLPADQFRQFEFPIIRLDLPVVAVAHDGHLGSRRRPTAQHFHYRTLAVGQAIPELTVPYRHGLVPNNRTPQRNAYIPRLFNNGTRERVHRTVYAPRVPRVMRPEIKFFKVRRPAKLHVTQTSEPCFVTCQLRQLSYPNPVRPHPLPERHQLLLLGQRAQHPMPPSRRRALRETVQQALADP